MDRKHIVATVLLAALAIVPARLTPASAQTTASRTFSETGQTVQGVFLDYWEHNGGLPQFGFPISDERFETSELDGRRHKVQYFERAVFERHSDNKPPYDVLLVQLGTLYYRVKHGDEGAPGQRPNQTGVLFPETGHYLGGGFLAYWRANGGVMRQGYPVSDEFDEVSEIDGKTYAVQYFERAVMEYHPENPPGQRVLLSLLGVQRLRDKEAAARATPTTVAPVTSLPTITHEAATPPTGTPVSSTPAPAPTSVPSGCPVVDDSRKARIEARGPVAIEGIHYAGQEYVEIGNNGSEAANIGGWVLRDRNDSRQSYTFPTGTVLPPGATLQVYTEPGHEHSFGSRASIWNNCGDVAELLDSAGTVVATFAYNTHLLP
jgi:hypothetical protein